MHGVGCAVEMFSRDHLGADTAAQFAEIKQFFWGGTRLNPRLNKSGYYDPTAYDGEKQITEEEQKDADLVWIIKKISRWAGFEIINRIEFRNRVSGRKYR